MTTLKFGEFLFLTLQACGVKDIFGVPGDSITSLQKYLLWADIRDVALKTESATMYSAGAYALERGLGVCYTTHVVGTFNLLNALAEAKLSHMPAVLLAGEPARDIQNRNPCMIHHQIYRGDFGTQERVLKEVIGEKFVVRLHRPLEAPGIIRKYLMRAIENQSPIAFSIPADMWDQDVGCTKEDICPILGEEVAQGCEAKLFSLLQAKTKLGRAKKPVIVIGHLAERFGLLAEALALSETLNIPMVTFFNSYGTVPANHPMYRGTYLSEASEPKEVFDLVRNSDFRIEIGCTHTDINYAMHLPDLRHAEIVLEPERLSLSVDHATRRVSISEQKRFLAQLRGITPKEKPEGLAFLEKIRMDDAVELAKISDGSKIRMSDISPIINEFLGDKPETPIVTDIGDSMFLALKIPCRKFYNSRMASMGSFPACIGYEIANGHPPLVITGDGAFAMGMNELISLPQYGLRPIILVVNNAGWAMMRASYKSASFYFPPTLHHEKITGITDSEGFIAWTPKQLKTALEKSWSSKSYTVINIMVGRDDTTRQMKAIIKAGYEKKS